MVAILILKYEALVLGYKGGIPALIFSDIINYSLPCKDLNSSPPRTEYNEAVDIPMCHCTSAAFYIMQCFQIVFLSSP